MVFFATSCLEDQWAIEDGPCTYPTSCLEVGLLLLFASYLGVYTVSGMALTGIAGAALGGIVFPVLIASIAMPLLTRVMFKLVGVSVSRAD